MLLRDALHYRSVFTRLKTSNCRKYQHISPSKDEWGMAVKVFQCLKSFCNLTELLSSSSYPTANLFYKGLCEIKERLDKWCVSGDLTIRQMAVSMRIKFEKYWNSLVLVLLCHSFFTLGISINL
jgi:hypothetical protein